MRPNNENQTDAMIFEDCVHRSIDTAALKREFQGTSSSKATGKGMPKFGVRLQSQNF